MKKFLLIDDDPSRKDNYFMFFDFLELVYLNNKDELDEINLSEFSGFILDVIYQKDSIYKDLSFDYVVGKLPPNKPIYIISSDWQTVMRNRKIEKLVQMYQQGQFLGFFSWETITSEQQQGLTISKEYAKTNWLTYNSLSLDDIPDDQNILILQISDLEFGNPNQTPFIKTSRELLYDQIRNDAKRFGKNRIDFLVVCGDVAFTGSEEQYSGNEGAKNWLMTFAKELIVRDDFQSRLMIVPGNHDCNLNALLGNFYRIEHVDKTKQFVVNKNETTVADFSSLGIYNYAHFVYNLTYDNSLLINPNQPVICRRFENIGINFILINSVFFSEDMKFKYRLTDEYIAKILAESKSINENACNIVVSHFAPDYINVEDPTSDATHHIMVRMVDAINAKVWLYGHAHSRPVFDDIQIGSKGNKTCLSRACALMLQSSGRCDDSSNGYTLINLQRKNGKVSEIQYLWQDKEKGILIKSINSPFR